LTSATSNKDERVKELDGLRALAILAVVAWHYLGIGDGPASIPWRIFMSGRSGVDLFFVLSGYLITGILLGNAHSPSYFSTFYVRRALRILPIYAVMFVIYLIGRQLGGSAPVLFGGPLPWWSYAIGLQNIWMTIHQDYGAAWLAGTWSLAVEEQFYLVFPLVVYFAPARMLPRLLIALLVLAPLGRMIAGALGDRFGYYVLMPLRADILAIGALVAWLEFSGPISPSIRRISGSCSGRASASSRSSPGLSSFQTSPWRCGAIPTWWRCSDRCCSWCSTSGARPSSRCSEAPPRRSSPAFPTRSIWLIAMF
jgi:peptidoglycan/LPS O-acetylase OafA/YrhL